MFAAHFVPPMRNVLRVLGCVLLAACAAPATAESTPQKPKSTTSIPSDPSDPSTPSPPAPGATDAGPRKGIEAFPGSKIFMPPTTPAPAIVMLHGSEGGSAVFIDQFAAQMAKEGFVVVTFCWFGCSGRPDKILRIPLESVIDVGQWLAGSPDVASGKVGLFGWSRGAELSLLLTSLADTAPFQAVAVHAPSDTVVSAFDPATENNPPDYGGITEPDATGKVIPAPSWTWKGQPLFGEPTADFSVPGPKIAVASYHGPVYVSQGENDEVWPVTRGRAVVAARNAVPGLFTQSHFFPGEGHVLQQPADLAAQETEVASFFHMKLAP
jgi:dienelactone hydrolase